MADMTFTQTKEDLKIKVKFGLRFIRSKSLHHINYYFGLKY